MPTAKTCGQCGAEIAIDALMGLCRACLFDYATRPSEPAPTAVASGRNFADYTLGRQLGRGGMGVVYEAVQNGLHRSVALKMILDAEATSPTARRRFTLEAETAASLDHPNIVPIYEIGEHQGHPFLSMKLITGDDLRKKIASGDLCLTPKENGASRFNLRERAASIVRVMATIARAVHHAHTKHVLHRDLKPANILLDTQGQPHLTDFGLAKILGPAAETTPAPATGSGTALGTPSYMSPEQAAGQRLTPASDVYSLGTILYEMLTGSAPFKAGTLLELLRLIAEQEPKAPSTFNPRVDKDLDTICIKCLEKDPGARYPTAEMLADDLEHWLKGEPISARRVGILSRTGRWVRRNPVGTGLIASLCAGLAVSVTLLLFELHDRERRRDEVKWVSMQIEKKIDNAWANDSEEMVVIPARDLAALDDRPIPSPNALQLTFALNIPDNPVPIATAYARFIGELDKQMSRALKRQVNFDLQLYKARSWEALIGARKGADLQGMTFLTYVRMKETSPDIQPVVVERHRSEGVIYARTDSGLSNLTQVSGHRMAFAHTNSIVSFLAKVALAQSGLCATNLGYYTNLDAPRFQSQRTAPRQGQAETEGLGNEGFAHKDVLAKVLKGEFELGVAPYRRFHLKTNELVELHRFQITPDVYVAKPGLSNDVVRALQAALLGIKNKTILGSTKPGMRYGFEAVKDADFDWFRKLLTNEWHFFETGQPRTTSGKSNSLPAPAR